MDVLIPPQSQYFIYPACRIISKTYLCKSLFQSWYRDYNCQSPTSSRDCDFQSLDSSHLFFKIYVFERKNAKFYNFFFGVLLKAFFGVLCHCVRAKLSNINFGCVKEFTIQYWNMELNIINIETRSIKLSIHALIDKSQSFSPQQDLKHQCQWQTLYVIKICIFVKTFTISL